MFADGVANRRSSVASPPFLVLCNFPQQRVTHQDTISFLFFCCWGGGGRPITTPPLNLESRGGVFQNGPVATHPLPEDGVRQWAAAWELVCRVVALRSQLSPTESDASRHYWGGGAAYYRTPPLNLESRGGVFQNGPVATHPLPEDGVRQWAAAWQLVCRVVALRSVRQRQAGGDARQLLGWTVGRAAGEAVGLAG